ncbi:unnamed protein product, partial [Mesorhabditis belari]|uniref:Uncharacterized protein n=1 Tax=Mesorhabditis belari TaxID=2138241 RepID=A0AAF3FGG5_9BILA
MEATYAFGLSYETHAVLSIFLHLAGVLFWDFRLASFPEKSNSVHHTIADRKSVTHHRAVTRGIPRKRRQIDEIP